MKINSPSDLAIKQKPIIITSSYYNVRITSRLCLYAYICNIFNIYCYSYYYRETKYSLSSHMNSLNSTIDIEDLNVLIDFPSSNCSSTLLYCYYYTPMDKWINYAWLISTLFGKVFLIPKNVEIISIPFSPFLYTYERKINV